MTEDKLNDMYRRNCLLTQHMVEEVDPRKLGMKLMTDDFRRRCFISMCIELGEMGQNINFKWWGRGVDKTLKEGVIEEGIDLLHFLLGMFQSFGMTADDIYAAYVKKNDVNWKRLKEKIGWDEVNP